MNLPDKLIYKALDQFFQQGYDLEGEEEYTKYEGYDTVMDYCACRLAEMVVNAKLYNGGVETSIEFKDKEYWLDMTIKVRECKWIYR